MKIFLKLLKILGISAFLSIAAVFIYGFFVVAPRIETKNEAFHSSAKIEFDTYLESVSPEAQFETDTCGLHTLRVIYKSYGLNPEKENLRKRIGLDVPTNPANKTTTGTLQPDLLRVIIQDGFSYELTDLGDKKYAEQKLLGHLESKNMAAVLIARRENMSMHWVAVRAYESNKIEVLDSLHETPYLEVAGDFLDKCVLSCILIRVRTDKTDDMHFDPLFDGTKDMINTLRHYKRIKNHNKATERNSDLFRSQNSSP